MGNFIKAIFISLLLTVLLCSIGHEWVGFNLSLDDELLEPVVALGVIMSVFVTVLVVACLVIAGVLGSVLLFGLFFVAAIAGIMAFFGLFFSWPVIFVALILWLLLREKPNKNNSIHY